MYTLITITAEGKKITDDFSSYSEAFEWFESARYLVNVEGCFLLAALLDEEGDILHTSGGNGNLD